MRFVKLEDASLRVLQQDTAIRTMHEKTPQRCSHWGVRLAEEAPHSQCGAFQHGEALQWPWRKIAQT